MTDVIIVGRGLAASVLAHTLHRRNISFQLIGKDGLSNCSRIAAGIWNPLVFKRFTKSWLADDLIPFLNRFYLQCEQDLKKKIVTQRKLIKPFTEDQEKKLWLKKSQQELAGFIEEKLFTSAEEQLAHFKLSNGYGCVKNAGNLDVAGFIDATGGYLRENISDEIFDYEHLRISDGKVIYRELEAKSIIFCEGYLVKNNPYFRWIPLNPVKGEIVTVTIPELTLRESIFNRNGFIMDLGEGNYTVGATYVWDDLEPVPTQKGMSELHQKIRNMITCDYSLVSHQAGIRPSSLDRRPLIGAHPLYPNLFVFNGLGTKGVMLAPFFAENFVNFLLQKEPLHKDVNVSRFYRNYVS